MAERARRRANVCENPKCDRGEDGGRAVFLTSNPAMYCSGACRQAAVYARRRAERLVELGLVRRRR